jgi:hypothetical protein
MSNKKRKPITRETILQDIGKTEDDIINGISVHDIVPFFTKYNLQLQSI